MRIPNSSTTTAYQPLIINRHPLHIHLSCNVSSAAALFFVFVYMFPPDIDTSTTTKPFFPQRCAYQQHMRHLHAFLHLHVLHHMYICCSLPLPRVRVSSFAFYEHVIQRSLSNNGNHYLLQYCLPCCISHQQRATNPNQSYSNVFVCFAVLVVIMCNNVPRCLRS
jgi:hypothetical protein